MTYDPFDRINQGAVDYARERAAGSNTAWRPIWQVLAEGLASGRSCASMVEAATALGLPREVAAPAVEHVLAEANSMAALRGLFASRASGVDVLKAWLSAKDPCDACRANAAQGAIPLEMPFASGHMAPPACLECRCSLIPASRV